MKSTNRISRKLRPSCSADQANEGCAPTQSVSENSRTAIVLEEANRFCDPDLTEFTMHLGVAGRRFLADRFSRWAEQLRSSAKFIEIADAG